MVQILYNIIKIIIGLVIFFIILFLVLLVSCMIMKKIYTIQTENNIKKKLIFEPYTENELETGDILMVLNKNFFSDTFHPCFFTHSIFVYEEENQKMILNISPFLNGTQKYTVDYFLQQYCGDVYFIKLHLTQQEKNRIKNKLRENIECCLYENPLKHTVITFFNVLINNSPYYTCTGFIYYVLYGEKQNFLLNDELFKMLIPKIKYIKQIKKQNINDKCYGELNIDIRW